MLLLGACCCFLTLSLFYFYFRFCNVHKALANPPNITDSSELIISDSWSEVVVCF